MSADTLPMGGRRSHSGGASALVHRLALAYGRSPAGMSQALYGPVSIPNRMEDLLFKLVRFGAVDLARRLLHRLTAVVEQRAVQPPTIALRLESQEIDQREDVLELAFELDRSDENLDRLVRAKEKSAYLMLAECDALKAEQRRRGVSQ